MTEAIIVNSAAEGLRRNTEAIIRSLPSDNGASGSVATYFLQYVAFFAQEYEWMHIYAINSSTNVENRKEISLQSHLFHFKLADCYYNMVEAYVKATGDKKLLQHAYEQISKECRRSHAAFMKKCTLLTYGFIRDLYFFEAWHQLYDTKNGTGIIHKTMRLIKKETEKVNKVAAQAMRLSGPVAHPRIADVSAKYDKLERYIEPSFLTLNDRREQAIEFAVFKVGREVNRVRCRVIYPERATERDREECHQLANSMAAELNSGNKTFIDQYCLKQNIKVKCIQCLLPRTKVNKKGQCTSCSAAMSTRKNLDKKGTTLCKECNMHFSSRSFSKNASSCKTCVGLTDETKRTPTQKMAKMRVDAANRERLEKEVREAFTDYKRMEMEKNRYRHRVNELEAKVKLLEVYGGGGGGGGSGPANADMVQFLKDKGLYEEFKANPKVEPPKVIRVKPMPYPLIDMSEYTDYTKLPMDTIMADRGMPPADRIVDTCRNNPNLKDIFQTYVRDKLKYNDKTMSYEGHAILASLFNQVSHVALIEQCLNFTRVMNDDPKRELFPRDLGLEGEAPERMEDDPEEPFSEYSVEDGNNTIELYRIGEKVPPPKYLPPIYVYNPDEMPWIQQETVFANGCLNVGKIAAVFNILRQSDSDGIYRMEGYVE